MTLRLLWAIVCFWQLASVAAWCGQSKEGESSQHLLKAEAAYSRDDWKVAVDEYREVIRSDPSNAEALVHLGIAEQRIGMPKEAESCFEKALQLKPSLPEVDVLLGLVRIQLGKYREAIAPLEGAFGKSDYNVAVRSAAGQRLVEIYYSLGQQEEALDMVQRLRKLAPDDPDVLYTASKVYAGLWNEAVQRLLAKSPDSYRIHQVLAEVAEAQGNYAEAAKEYRLIVKMAPELLGFHYRLGRAILESDTSPEASKDALQAFQKEIELNPRDAQAHTQIGEVYLKSHETEAAEHYLSHAVELDPADAAGRVGYAKVLLEEKRFQEAAEQLEKAVRLSPEDETIYYNLMIAYRGLGRVADAQHALENFQRLSKQKQAAHASIMSRLKGAMGGTQATNP
jgi:tetratricopeptide (TPR) repeat protein